MTTLLDLWDYDDPAGSEVRFKVKATEVSLEDPLYWIIQTQIARTHSLRSNCDTAHTILDRVEEHITRDRTLQVHYLLERGRTYNSGGEPDRAEPLFLRAWEVARLDETLDILAVDAAHMLAIIADGDEGMSWNITALEHARRSDHPATRRWEASLLNNLGWFYHDKGAHQQALTHFQKALALREELGNEADIRIARWCVGRCLRSLARYSEALAIQQGLLGGPSQGFVEEEMAELLYLLGRTAEAQPYYAAAYKKLTSNGNVIPEQRLERLKRMAES